MLFIRKGLPLVSSTCGWRNKNVKWNSKMKNKTSKAFQRTLLALTGKEKTFIKMMRSCRRFLIMWNDGKYMMQAHEFVQDRLRDITSDAVKRGWPAWREKWVSF